MTGRRYASSTSVPSDASRAEIERTLVRYNATQFAYGWTERGASLGFVIGGRAVRFSLPLPDRNDERFRLTPGRKLPRSAEAQAAEWEQAVRQSWRALALVIKAKLEAVEAGITTVEDEFLAHTLLPTGATVAEWLGPQIDEAYRTRHMPALLAAPHQFGGA